MAKQISVGRPGRYRIVFYVYQNKITSFCVGFWSFESQFVLNNAFVSWHTTLLQESRVRGEINKDAANN
jgi:hypothetical protein